MAWPALTTWVDWPGLPSPRLPACAHCLAWLRLAWPACLPTFPVHAWPQLTGLPCVHWLRIACLFPSLAFSHVACLYVKFFWPILSLHALDSFASPFSPSLRAFYRLASSACIDWSVLASLASFCLPASSPWLNSPQLPSCLPSASLSALPGVTSQRQPAFLGCPTWPSLDTPA